MTYEATVIDEDGSTLWMESDDLKEIEDFIEGYEEYQVFKLGSPMSI